MTESSLAATTAAGAEMAALLERAVDMHTLPVVVLESHRLMQNPRTSAQDVANLLSRDPPLAGRILKLANSPFYGFRRRIGNLTQAIVILGFQAVKNLMLTASVIRRYCRDNEQFDYSGFWANAVCSAMATHELARLTRSPHVNEAYIAGLLHDLGKLIVAQELPDLASKVRDLVRAGTSEPEAERQVLGLDHSDLGFRVISSWGLPATLAEAVRDHHHPNATGERATLAHVLHLSALIVDVLLARSPSVPLSPAAPELSVRLGYDADILAGWIEIVVSLFRRSQEFFDILGLAPLAPRPR